MFFFNLSPLDGTNGFDTVDYCKEMEQLLRQIPATSGTTIDSVTRRCIRWCRIDDSNDGGGSSGGGSGRVFYGGDGGGIITPLSCI